MFGSKIDPKVRRKLDEIGVDDVRARLEAINRVRDLGQEDAQNSGDWYIGITGRPAEYLAFCYEYASDRGQLFKEAD
jgi:hypothetical protein